MQNRWAKITHILQQTVSSGHCKVWIEPLSPQWEEGSLTLVAPNALFASFVQERLLVSIKQAVSQVAPECSQVSVTTACVASSALSTRSQTSSSDAAINTSSSATSTAANAVVCANSVGNTVPNVKSSTEDSPSLLKAPSRPTPRPLGAIQLSLPTPLPAAKAAPVKKNWRFSFNDFITGPSNELAYTASRAMCNMSQPTDILFLNSSPGLGKTHLMHAVGQSLSTCSNRSTPNVEYITAEEFASHFIHAIRTNDVDGFKHRYRTLDLLLLEDVHFLSGKDKTQLELLAVIKSLQERGGKLVCTSSFAPKELQKFDDQLLSRLHSGFISPIEKPDADTRKRIFRHKASLHQVILPENVEDLLAEQIQSDVRLMESCLQNLILKAQMYNSRTITTEMAWEVINNYAKQFASLDAQTILRHVCAAFGLTKTQLLSNSRKQDYVAARYTAFYLARKHTSLSLEAIGDLFNRRHSTVLKGITALEREISTASPHGMQMANVISMIEKNNTTTLVQ